MKMGGERKRNDDEIQSKDDYDDNEYKRFDGLTRRA